MAYNEKSKLSQILSEHPWLEQELPKRYPELKAMDNPAARFMLKRMTIQDAGKLGGLPTDQLLKMLEDLIAEKEGKA